MAYECQLRLILIAAIGLALVGCFTPPNWNGRWLVDATKSENAAPAFTIVRNPAGAYTISTGMYRYTFKCDGKDYPSAGDYTLTCTGESPLTMDTISKQQGLPVKTAHRELSSGGQSLSEVVRTIHKDGSMGTQTKQYVRIGGSTGFAGAWRDIAPFGVESKSRVFVTRMTNTSFHFEFPDAKQSVDLPLNGDDASVQGAPPSIGTTLSAKRGSAYQLLTTRKMSGRVITVGSLTLSRDGRTLTEEWWNPTQPDTKARKTYNRQ